MPKPIEDNDNARDFLGHLSSASALSAGVKSSLQSLFGVSPDSHTHTWTSITGKPATFTPSAHTHDDRYYTETEVDGFLVNYSTNGHTHSWGAITGKPSTFAPSTHNHDDRYYTETEIDGFLVNYSTNGHSHSWGQITGKPSTFAPSAHNHDNRYYTETEINGFASNPFSLGSLGVGNWRNALGISDYNGTYVNVAELNKIPRAYAASFGTAINVGQGIESYSGYALTIGNGSKIVAWSSVGSNVRAHFEARTIRAYNSTGTAHVSLSHTGIYSYSSYDIEVASTNRRVLLGSFSSNPSASVVLGRASNSYVGFFGSDGRTKPTISYDGSNHSAALNSLLTELQAMGLINYNYTGA
ncbi:MAG: hypothetical protein ACQKBY_09760 [Verrucomicrobiales bacterium]